jgi:hypothetical protein
MCPVGLFYHAALSKDRVVHLKCLYCIKRRVLVRHVRGKLCSKQDSRNIKCYAMSVALDMKKASFVCKSFYFVVI